ncbi:hypothetical protein Rumeso_04498 [Rubellimicrobium mesophilum DSM 19309]|uniref:DUF4383 domain-containing protein n=1 Tax=Rubellimicrobium mesophilum DSM 19309 TaxID=442562 RepID=A0A017HHS2_9RHOB|nr:DUF4383 domain-containing protein [Rubellimicrobium mesophilum]EYD73901.1 hypothetical protein Rumeso_04498 [Rubellimicrobium mesophilum DSM 19309]
MQPLPTSRRFGLHRAMALGYFLVLAGVAALNYVPGIPRPDGAVFGIFALDVYDDALHLASALWALAAALISARAARLFLLLFGAAYLLDGLMGLTLGSGYLDLGILNTGIQDLPLTFRILANLPHIALGGIALATGLRRGRREALR